MIIAIFSALEATKSFFQRKIAKAEQNSLLYFAELFKFYYKWFKHC